MEENEIDYKELYFKLYADVADIIEKLQDIQRKYEEMYCNTK